jgi:hypothetical protein
MPDPGSDATAHSNHVVDSRWRTRSATSSRRSTGAVICREARRAGGLGGLPVLCADRVVGPAVAKTIKRAWLETTAGPFRRSHLSQGG